MKHQRLSQDPKTAAISRSVAVQPMDPSTPAFVPSPDEVARRAYFAYVNQGSLEGHEVQHWLGAEADLIAERNLTRVHGFRHQT